MKLKNILLPGFVAMMISGCDGYALKSDLYNNFAAEPTSNGLCQVTLGNPECNFTDMPAVEGNIMRIENSSEENEILVIRGVLKDVEGIPLSNAYLYGFLHQDHVKYQGWCKTNESGEYEIRTNHPEASTGLQPHIHLAVKLTRLKKALYLNDLILNENSRLLVKDIII